MTTETAPGSEFEAYAILGRKSNDKSFTLVVDIKTTLEGLRESYGGEASSEVGDGLEAEDAPLRELTDVGKGVWHFYMQLKAYYEVSLAIDIIPDMFVQAFFRHSIMEYAEKNFAKVEEKDRLPVYGLTADSASILSRRIDRWNNIDTGFETLPASILLSLVASFDSSFADFCKVLLKTKPQRYTGSDRTYSVADMLKLGSFDELLNRVIDDEIDQLMNKSHVDQIGYFEKSFNVNVREHYDRWNEFVEIFERRNLAAHGSLIVNERYLSNIPTSGKNEDLPALGDKLTVDTAYLDTAIDILIEFGILLAFAAWQKQAPSSIPETFDAIIEVSYNLLVEERSKVAHRILTYAMSVKSKGATDVDVKMMTINLAIAHKMCGDETLANEVIDSCDWSAANPKFSICAAAVKGDVEKVCSLLPAVKALGEVTTRELRDWPAFKWVRQAPEFVAKVEEVFGEPLTVLRVASGKDEGDAKPSTPESKTPRKGKRIPPGSTKPKA